MRQKGEGIDESKKRMGWNSDNSDWYRDRNSSHRTAVYAAWHADRTRRHPRALYRSRRNGSSNDWGRDCCTVQQRGDQEVDDGAGYRRTLAAAYAADSWSGLPGDRLCVAAVCHKRSGNGTASGDSAKPEAEKTTLLIFV